MARKIARLERRLRATCAAATTAATTATASAARMRIRTTTAALRPLTSIVTICPTRGFSTCGRYVTVTLSPGLDRVAAPTVVAQDRRRPARRDRPWRALQRRPSRRTRAETGTRTSIAVPVIGPTACVRPFDVAAVVRRSRPGREPTCGDERGAHGAKSSIASSLPRLRVTSSTLRPRRGIFKR